MKTTTATLLLLLAGAAQATVAGSKHDLSATGTGIHSPTTPQVCLFCHTPHGGLSLWNRAPSTTAPESIRLYASPSLSAAGSAARLDGKSRSMLCLSCHGEPLANIGGLVLNTLGNDMAVVDPRGAWTTSGVLWDRVAVNHPIGFDYAQALAAKPTRLEPLSGTNVGLLPLFNATAQGSTVTTSMECSTCHTVHDATNSPFLRVDNASNGLCLACHIR